MNTNTYTRSDIVKDVSERLNMPKVTIRKVLDSIIDSMTDILTKPSSNTRVELRKFGVFEVKPTKARHRARNPRTNEEVYVPAHRKIAFKPGILIREIIYQEWIDK